MSPDWPEWINVLASAQRSLASEITCGLTLRDFCEGITTVFANTVSVEI